MTRLARGRFDVKITPLAPEADDDTKLGRLALHKTFHGDLEATSRGQMFAARTAIENSAGYVALERVTGRLHERTGTFVLQHSGTMNRARSRSSSPSFQTPARASSLGSAAL